MEFGKVVTFYRKLRSKSQAEVAFLSNMTISELQRIELGTLTPAPESPEMESLCAGLDIPEGVLLLSLSNSLVEGLPDYMEQLEDIAIKLIEFDESEVPED